MQDIRELEEQGILEFVTHSGEKPFRARQIMDWLWKKGARDFNSMSNLPLTLRKALSENFRFDCLEISTSQVSRDGTRKYGFSGVDGHLAEGVLIPSRARVTACLSSQIGCPLNCSFCATARLKSRRNLSAGEIIDQVSLLQESSQEAFGRGLSNLVFMGMGEPLLNYGNVIRAVRTLISEKGMGISPRRITLSTAGLVQGINRLAGEGIRLELAVSLHTANDDKRSMIMPVNRSNPLPLLSESIAEYHKRTGSRITYEYLLMRDFNDGPADARELADFCRISPCKINLIEYNDVAGSSMRKSPPERMEAFREFLASKNLVVNVRRSRGEDIAAACGQLAGQLSRDGT